MAGSVWPAAHMCMRRPLWGVRWCVGCMRSLVVGSSLLRVLVGAVAAQQHLVHAQILAPVQEHTWVERGASQVGGR